MLIDKFETYIINVAGLKSRSTRKKLIHLCKEITFVNPFSILSLSKTMCSHWKLASQATTTLSDKFLKFPQLCYLSNTFTQPCK